MATKKKATEQVDAAELARRVANGEPLPAGYTYNPRRNPAVYLTSEAPADDAENSEAPADGPKE